jgi:transposase
VSRGGKPVLMTRKNTSSKAKSSWAWKEMMQYRQEHPRAFENRYHKRSNVESTNSSFKGKYSEFLYSRRWHTQKREAGLKVLVYNIRQLIRFRIRAQLEIWN